MIYLIVPFSEKEEAKSLFAKWDAVEKRWFASNPKYYYKFSKWLKGNLIFTDSINIVKGTTQCWKCKQHTDVYGFAVESKNIIDLTSNYPVNIFEETGYDLIIWSISDTIPSDIKVILEKDFGCKIKYSKTVNGKYFANVCSFCDSLQGDNFVYGMSGTFGELNTSNLILYKINLKNDFCSNLEINGQISPSVYYLDRCSFVETNYIIKN